MSEPFDSITPLFSKPEALKPPTQALLAQMRPAQEITPRLTRDYVIKGWLDRGTVSVVYGPSNVGKSFLALDWAHHVAKGITWGKRRVKRGRVLYIVAEGGANSDNRVAALDDPEFWVLSCPMVMTGGRSQAWPLADVVRHLAAVGGAPFSLIIFDTMARVMGARDENTATGIADLVNGLEGALRRALFTDGERPTHVIRFDRDNLTRADLGTRATVINSLIASRTINPDEGRGWIGLPPRAGGDEFLNPNITETPAPAAEDEHRNAAE